MKKIAKLSLCALAGAALTSCCTDKAASPGYVSREALASGFVTPPDSIQTSVYWYWISNNISKEGVVKDLESMKKAGINRAFIGNIGQDDVPYGNVKMLSDEWWDVLHTALKKATELDIEIGIFNSPGWSQAGGPWVEARRGDALPGLGRQRRGRRSARVVEARARSRPGRPSFTDVRVIAYAAPLGDGVTLNASTRHRPVSSGSGRGHRQGVRRRSRERALERVPKDGRLAVGLEAETPFTALHAPASTNLSGRYAFDAVAGRVAGQGRTTVSTDTYCAAFTSWTGTNPAPEVGFRSRTPR